MSQIEKEETNIEEQCEGDEYTQYKLHKPLPKTEYFFTSIDVLSLWEVTDGEKVEPLVHDIYAADEDESIWNEEEQCMEPVENPSYTEGSLMDDGELLTCEGVNIDTVVTLENTGHTVEDVEEFLEKRNAIEVSVENVDRYPFKEMPKEQLDEFRSLVKSHILARIMRKLGSNIEKYEVTELPSQVTVIKRYPILKSKCDADYVILDYISSHQEISGEIKVHGWKQTSNDVISPPDERAQKKLQGNKGDSKIEYVFTEQDNQLLLWKIDEDKTTIIKSGKRNSDRDQGLKQMHAEIKEGKGFIEGNVPNMCGMDLFEIPILREKKRIDGYEIRDYIESRNEIEVWLETKYHLDRKEGEEFDEVFRIHMKKELDRIMTEYESSTERYEVLSEYIVGNVIDPIEKSDNPEDHVKVDVEIHGRESEWMTIKGWKNIV